MNVRTGSDQKPATVAELQRAAVNRVVSYLDDATGVPAYGDIAALVDDWTRQRNALAEVRDMLRTPHATHATGERLTNALLDKLAEFGL